MARRFGNVFRYIDDLLAISDNGEFERNYRNIYPPEQALKKKNVNNLLIFSTIFCTILLRYHSNYSLVKTSKLLLLLDFASFKNLKETF